MKRYPFNNTQGASEGPLAGLLTAVARMAVVILAVAFPGTTVAQRSTMHPPFPLLDENGQNVLVSGAPASTMNTCGTCHDIAAPRS